NAKPVDASGVLTLPISGRVEFKNAVDLMHRLAPLEETHRCLVRQWFRFALGRLETDADEGSIEAVYRKAGVGAVGLREVIAAITQSSAFLQRAPAPGETP